MTDPVPPAAPGAPTLPAVAHLEAKAAGLLLLMAALVCGAIGYLLYARGAFEPTQRLVLVADDSEGVVVGMDLTFSGFPVGRVKRIELGADGSARIVIDVPRKDAHWLRTSSVFTLVRGLVGNTNLRAYSGVLGDPPLPDNAERRVLAGDASAEIPKLMAAARELTQNLNRMVAPDAALAGSLANLQTATGRLSGPRGALGLLLGNEADAQRLLATLDRTNALLARIDALAQHADTLVVKADSQVFGPQGLMPETRQAVEQLGALLGEARASLTRVDKVLADAQAIASDARSASTDLGALRAEVEASLRKVQQLVDEVNRKWPFARDAELKLP
ncbi:MAG: MCE family protein [Burkholderiaceae bacterium]|nr:MCE family protein [Burkholderiaceae bacterium]